MKLVTLADFDSGSKNEEDFKSRVIRTLKNNNFLKFEAKLIKFNVARPFLLAPQFVSTYYTIFNIEFLSSSAHSIC